MQDEFTPAIAVSDDVMLVVALLVLIVVPRALQRYRIPAAITSLLLGFGAHQSGIVASTPALRLLSTLGIVALFLFAGLEIDGRELRRHARPLTQFGAIWLALVAITSLAAGSVLHIGTRPSILMSLALLTPSTGFILSSLSSTGYSAEERFAIKTKAISTELLALLMLFFVMQTTSARQLLFAMAAMAAILFVVPLAFRMFAAVVAPYAPRSEFAFLLGVAIVTAIVTRELGVYYLLGAFLVGVAAQRFRKTMPAMSSDQMINALEAFGSVFIPFYFFMAGMHIDTQQTTWWALAFGAALLCVFVPLRIGVVFAYRRVALKELGSSPVNVATALIPTLVFTLVLTELMTRFAVPEFALGALIIYTVVNTMVPGLVRGAPPAFEQVHAPPSSPPGAQSSSDEPGQ